MKESLERRRRLERLRLGWVERPGMMNNISQETIDNFYSAIPCPYLAWRQYLPDTVYSDSCQ